MRLVRSVFALLALASTLSLIVPSAAHAQSQAVFCATRLFKRLLGVATPQDPRLPPDLMSRAIAACAEGSYEKLYGIANEITQADLFLLNSIIPFSNMMSDLGLDHTSGTQNFTMTSTFLFMLSIKNLSIKTNIFSSDDMIIGHPNLGPDFKQPIIINSQGQVTQGFVLTARQLTQSDSHPRRVNDLYAQGLCDLQKIDKPGGCWRTIKHPTDNFKTLDEPAFMAPEKAAGLLTLPRSRLAYTGLNVGTNRRMIAHLFNAFLCTELDEVKDASLPDLFVARDVARAPGGSVQRYQRDCKGCHAPLDALYRAFAGVEWINKTPVIELVFEHYSDPQSFFGLPAGVPLKMNRNNANPNLQIPYITNDSWVNLWANHPRFGWRSGSGFSINSGSGPRELGLLLTHSEAFANCMPERIFKLVCGGNLSDEVKKSMIADVRARIGDQDTLRRYFAAVAAHPACTGGY